MFAEIESAEDVYRPSEFWREYVELNLRQLNEHGFENFKRTVNRNYFQFEFQSPLHPLARKVWRRWLRTPRKEPLQARHTPGHGLEVEGEGLWQRLRAVSNAQYIALLTDIARAKDTWNLLDRLEEPLLGNPVCVDYRGRRVSEDLCNSVIEFTAVANALPSGTLDSARVIELGSGYGRLAWLYLSAVPTIRYVLVDIPPALGIAEQYLAEMFPERRIFGFRQFESEAEVAEELETAQIAFLTPNQLDLLPGLKAELFLNVSSLHEMLPHQIEHYFRVIERHTAGWFYSKQWYKSTNTPDALTILKEDYPVRGDWETVFDREHPTSGGFFEALYKIA